MVEKLEQHPYSSFPLYADEENSAPAFLDQELLRELLPGPFEKTNLAYCMYCLTYTQNAKEVKHVEEMEPPVM